MTEYSYIWYGEEFVVREANTKDICLISLNNLRHHWMVDINTIHEIERNPVKHYLDDGYRFGIWRTIVYTKKRMGSTTKYTFYNFDEIE